MRHPKKLKVKSATAEDVRQLLCRIDAKTFEDLGLTKDKYLDAAVIRLSKDGRTISLLARTPIDPEKDKDVTQDTIRLDEWSRFKLCADKEDEITVNKASLRDVISYVLLAITRHPDIAIRWQNIGVALAVISLMVALPGILLTVWSAQVWPAWKILVTVFIGIPLLMIIALIRSLPKW